jgi:REP element-mobilizing transposase RayT
VALYHVNFHTLRSVPVFEQPEYAAMMRSCLRELLRRHRILCLAWELMPTHVHLIIEDFRDFSCSQIVGRIKGGTSHAFFQEHPFLREDFLGGHLWAKGYYSVLVAAHEQFCATLAYVRTNRERADLPPPVPLERHD